VSRWPLWVYVCLPLAGICSAVFAAEPALAAEQVQPDTARVVITGARRVAEARLREWLRGPDGMQRLARAYEEAGNWSATITDSAGRDAAGDSIRWVHVVEGPQAAVTAEPFAGPGDSSRAVGEVPPRFHEEPASFGAPGDVAAWIDDYLRRQANRGHPFAAAELVAAREPEAGHVVVEARLTPGPLVRIGEVRAMGNTVTRTATIARELRAPLGSIYDERAVERWKRRLERAGYFETIGEPALVWRDSSRGVADLVIPVTEGRPNRFEGIVGYQPGTDTERGQFTGLVDLALGNLWGTGRRLVARWERPLPRSTTLDLGYREPWIGGFPVDLDGRVAVEQRPGYAVERIDAGLSGEILPDFVLGAGVGREVVRSDSIALLGGPRYRGYVVSISADYDTRDNILNPVRGGRYSFAWQASFRRNRVGDADFVAHFGADAWPERERASTVRLDLEHYVPVGSAFVLAAGWHGAQATGAASAAGVSAADGLRLGGVTTVRGYREDQFIGSRVAWGNHEWRYRVGAASRLFAFLDAGAVWSRRHTTTGTREGTSWLVGYGLGLRAETRAGLLGVDFGWPRGEGFERGKVHVRLESTF